MRSGNRTVLALLLMVGGLGCAHAVPPPPGELIEARAAYSRATTGAAAEGAPAHLRVAREALDEAERAYAQRADQQAVRDRAYIALRTIQTAEADGATAVAAERRRHALEQLAALPGRYADKARAEMAVQRRDRSAPTGPAGQAAPEPASPPPVVESTALTAQEARAASDARVNQVLNTLSHDARVRREGRGLVITIAGPLFAEGEATLLSTATAGLNDVATALGAMSGTPGRIVIEGRGDPRGTPAQSRALAERRAAAVRDYLVARGVSADLVAVQAAADQPVPGNDPAASRRVEIVVPQQPTARPGPEPAVPGPPPASPATTTTPTFPLPRPAVPAQPETRMLPPAPDPGASPAPAPDVPRP
jgi:outer membrane protein OmpA-like peptidoglycan-associated protein